MSTFTIGTSEEKIRRNDWLTPYIRDSLYDPASATMRTQKKLYPSSAGLCARRNFLTLKTEYLDAFSASGVLYTTIGNAVHEAIQDGIKAKDPKALMEFRLKDETLMLSGRADIIMRDKVKGAPFVIDIKTTGAIPKAPKADHVRQLAVYAILTGIKDTEIYYVSRNVGNPPKMKGYTIDFNEEKYAFVLNEVVKTIAISVASVEHGEIPERKKYISKCKYCPFSDICWSEPKDILLLTSYTLYEENNHLEQQIEIINYINEKMKESYERFNNLV